METLSALQRVVYDSAPWAGTAMAVALLTKSSRFIGWLGERRLRIATYFQLDRRSYHRFHDVLLRSPDGTTQIDHVVISAQGVFVIETKTMKGWIFGNERERNWTQKLRRRTFTFMNPLRQNYKHVKAVQEALDLAPEVIHSVVVFVGRAKFITLMPANVIRLSRLRTLYPLDTDGRIQRRRGAHPRSQAQTKHDLLSVRTLGPRESNQDEPPEPQMSKVRSGDAVENGAQRTS
jgi:hypothetical protein